ARSQPNQGENEGVYNHTRPSLSPPIWQEIARNATPQVIFFTKIKTITRNQKITTMQIEIFSVPAATAGMPYP
ncbi:MAG: hypothetical protein IKC94_00290, partial [Lentisphaeria bacterium]|nr:hypothetical protein [Lentisphaeria bacterium]